MTESSNEFDAAKSIFDTLQGLDKEQQARALRWVAESLEIDLRVRAPHHEAPSPMRSAVGSSPIPESLDSSTSAVRSQDIKTFVDLKAPKSDVQFVTVVAYFYRFEASEAERKETIDSKALQEAARLSGRKRLTQPHMTLNNAKNSGYLDSATRGQFKINTVGENLVAMALPGKSQVAENRESAKPSRQR